jgi:predicted phage tail component-like protein
MFSFTYKGVSSIGKLKVLKVTRSLLPPSQNKFLEIDGMSGAKFISKKHGIKKIEVEVAIIDDALMSQVREVADWLDADQPEEFIASDEPTLKDFAILDGDIDLDEVFKVGFGTLVFLCPDPYSIGAEKTVSLTAGTTKTFTMEGTARSFPIVTATANSASSSFVVSRGDDKGNDDKVEIIFNFVGGEVVEIDFNTGKVTINGTINQQTITLDSDFWSLTPKSNNYIWSSSGFTSSLVYKERFK